MSHQRMQPFFSAAPLLRCPLCGGNLKEAGTALACPQGHTFALSSRGYGDFAPGKQGGMYDETLFAARRRILEGDFYTPALTLMGALMEKYAPEGAVLDAGCGEGTFLKRLCPQRRPALGVDLARAGIRLAAKGGNDYVWLVGDLTRLPVQRNTISCLLNILSPAEYPEFGRVLKEQGVLIKAVPGERYLQEIRTLAKDSLRQETYSNARVLERFKSRFTLLESLETETVFPLTPAQREDFLTMTPMMHHVDKTALPKETLTQVTIHLQILCGQAQV